MDRLQEPSTWAGIGALIPAVGEIIVTGGKSVTGWAALLAGLAAIIKREKAA